MLSEGRIYCQETTPSVGESEGAAPTLSERPLSYTRNNTSVRAAILLGLFTLYTMYGLDFYSLRLGFLRLGDGDS